MPTTHLNLRNLVICGLFSGSSNWRCVANSPFPPTPSYTPTASIGFTSNWVCFAIFIFTTLPRKLRLRLNLNSPRILAATYFIRNWVRFVIRGGPPRPPPSPLRSVTELSSPALKIHKPKRHLKVGDKAQGRDNIALGKILTIALGCWRCSSPDTTMPCKEKLG